MFRKINQLLCNHNYLYESQHNTERRKDDDKVILTSKIYSCIDCDKLVSYTEATEWYKNYYKS